MIDFIKNLSNEDKKTLSQKCLKLTEETGELAKVILPYDSAPGTNHRFVDKYRILEEIADVHLTNISIGYSLGFTDDEINDMIYKKAVKWSELQSKESKAKFPLPFEIHITIKNERIDEFKTVCQSIGVKPIVLDLELSDSIIKDVMTSSKHFGDNRSAYDESQRIVTELTKNGFTVVRVKIETVPWHPKAPSTKEEKMPEGCYFESHIGVIILPEDKDELNLFVNTTLKEPEHITLSGSAKLSQNFFKKTNDGSKFVNMLTYRSHSGTYDVFKTEVDQIKDLLNTFGFSFEKVEVEFSVYDTNVSHDVKWIS